MQLRIVMLVDLDYFFAQCEELRYPSLRNKPVVVCVYSGRTEDSGAVSTANYVARDYGVKSGMPIFLAKKKLMNVDAAFLPVDHQFYEEVSAKVINLLKTYADSFEQVGIDEAYLDVTKRTHGNFHEAEALAKALKDELRIRIGLTCTVGIGPNKLVAKIAADEKKPDGLTTVNHEQVPVFMRQLAVNRLLGVGTRTVEKMRVLGIITVGDLAQFDVQKLVAAFGKATGTYFHNASLGIDNEPVQEKGQAESLSRIATLKQDTRDLDQILLKADELCIDIHSRLTQEKLTFKTVSIIVITTDLKVYTRSRTFEEASNDFELMRKTVKELFEKYLVETEFEARRVGVKISNLSESEKSQRQITSFFEQ